nr:U-box domain-containing protein 35-like [Ipomoea batatas]
MSWLSNSNSKVGSPSARRSGGNGLVAVAIDKDKPSQYAIKWATENIVSKGQTVVLVHVATNQTPSLSKQQQEKQNKDLFLTFHCFCTRKEIHCLDIVIDGPDVAKALLDYVSKSAIENLVLGSSRHTFLKRLKVTDIPTLVSKGAPDFCTVYVISKSKISSVRNATRPAPFASPLCSQIQQIQEQSHSSPVMADIRTKTSPSLRGFDEKHVRSFKLEESESVRPSCPSFERVTRGIPRRMLGEMTETDSDLSFVSSGRPSSDRMSSIANLNDMVESGRTPRLSSSSDGSFGSGLNSFTDFSSSSLDNPVQDEGDAEMRRLKLELQKTMDLYSTACKEALTAKQKTAELQRWRVEEERRIKEESKSSGAENEHNNSRSLPVRYRRYTIDEIEVATEYFSEARKIGEGGYGPVFKCYLDHTVVAVKVLRPDAAQGREQFQQEVEILSCMRHPNMVLLLGACPEYGCLVYEYMGNGSVEDRLMRRGNKPALSWQVRFRIAAEIGTGLLFLHQNKPEPIVHRDLKPANVLLDQYYVSKISDVGLSRLVPPTVSEGVTQLRMTSAAGTFCYIDPEYQQTGMLGVKSDVYSFGIVLLQLLTAKAAMGISHHVGRAIDKGVFTEMLDPVVPDWPVEEALTMAKLALQCSELRRKDRPDLGKEVLPQLDRLRALADESISHFLVGGGAVSSPCHSQASATQVSHFLCQSAINLENVFDKK